MIINTMKRKVILRKLIQRVPIGEKELRILK
jgi:hypothetical protein